MRMSKYVIHDVFIETANKYRENTVFNYFDQDWKRVTYQELLGNTRGIASYLIGKGIKKGDKVAIISENRPEWCATYLAISLSGAVAVPIDAQLGQEEIKNLLHDSESKAGFFSERIKENIKKAIEDLVTHYSLSITQVNFDSQEFNNMCSNPEITEYPEVSEQDVASLIYTSGTTGIPKGVELTHKNFCSDAESLIQAGIVTHNDNVLSVLPLHHTYPFMCTFLVPVFLGASITYPESLKGPEIMTAIKEKRVSVFVGVPRLFELIRNGMINKMKQLPVPVSVMLFGFLGICGKLRGNTGVNLGKIIFRSAHKPFGRGFRFFASGGAKLDPEVIKDLESVGFTVLEGYGLTETSPVVTFNPISKRKGGSAGKPLPSVMIKIVDTKGGDVAAVMKEGEIAIKGPMVMKGYFKNLNLTDQVMLKGWFLSGDMGYLDRDGYLFITGRLKDVIVLSSGENVYPEDLERQYMKIPLIKEICIVGVEERGIAESLHAFIVPDMEYAKREKIGNIQESLRWEINSVSLNMQQYLRIRGFTLYPEPLPKTSLGKFRRFMIKDLVKAKREELRAKAEDKDLIKDETARKVIECIKPLLKEPVPIQGKDNLELDLGLDSLARIELVVALEKTFSTKLPESFASEIQTIEEIIRKIKEYEKGKAKEIERVVMWKDILVEESRLEDRRKIGLYHNFLERLVIICGLLTLKSIFKFFFRLKFEGLQNLPDKGSYIITPNHTSYIDGFAIVAALPFRLFWNLYSIGWQAYFTGPLGLFARLAHVIPIDRETYLQKALQMAAYVLRKGKSLLVFPEGGRSYDGELMEFKKGVGILALELNLPVVPTYIKGSFDVLPRGKKWLKFHEVTITFGKPVYPSDLNLFKKTDAIDNYQFFVNELREKVKQLKRI
jgi:long-chain acyl-CoA synthetase